MTSPSTDTGAGFLRRHPDGTASRGSRILGTVVLVSVVVFLYVALVASAPDQSLDAQGQLVRIMYLHVPSAITCYTAFFVTAVASGMYLWKRTTGWDALAASSAEIGVIFVVLTLLTGSIWGHTTWGTWWEWDPRLTSTALMFVMYLGYLALRRAILDPVSRGKQSAILGIIAFINVPIVHYSVDWWRSLHQTATVASLDPQIDGLRLFALMFGMIVALMLYVWLMMHRFRLAFAEAALEAKGLDLALAERRAEAQADGATVSSSIEPEGVGVMVVLAEASPWTYVGFSYALTVGMIGGYAAWVIRHGRKIGKQLPAEDPEVVIVSPDLPDDRDLDEGGLDLSPRDDAPVRAARTTRRRWAPIVVLCVLGLVIGVIAMQARGASLYFKNADEAVAEKESLGTKRFRLQGTVVGKPVEKDTSTEFTVQYRGVSVDVVHTGSEPAMFKAGIPVVAEGHWNEAGTAFDSDRLLVKHDADYKDYDEKNPERLDGDESNDT